MNKQSNSNRKEAEELKRIKRLRKEEYEPEQFEGSRQDLRTRSQYGAWPLDIWRIHD